MTEINSLEWHKENFHNWEQSLIRDKKKLEEDWERLEFFRFQIAEAEKLGKTSFNRDRFRKTIKVAQLGEEK